MRAQRIKGNETFEFLKSEETTKQGEAEGEIKAHEAIVEGNYFPELWPIRFTSFFFHSFQFLYF